MDGVKDIVPQLLEAIRESYKSNVNRNILLQKLINIIKDNKGDYETLLKVSKEYGIALSDAFKSNVTGDILPDGKMYYNIAERLLNELLRENYDNVAPLCETVQGDLNIQNGINLKAVKPSYKQEKVNGLIDYISGVVYEQREASFLDALITNSKSIVDDSVKENCEFQTRCGMSPVIERSAIGKTCKWCSELAGTYQYPDDVPDDVYKRHANCDCVVVYKPDKHAKDFQDVWSKQWNDKETAQRIEESKRTNLNLRKNTDETRLQIKLNTIFNSGDKLPSYTSLGIGIPENVSEYLKRLENEQYIVGKKGDFPISILPIMSREKDVEFAVISILDKSYLIRGTETETIIPDNLVDELIKHKGTLDYHSHPFSNDIIPSNGDCNTMSILIWQTESYIISENNKVAIFNSKGIIETGLSSEVVDKKNRKDLELLYKDLFGGD